MARAHWVALVDEKDITLKEVKSLVQGSYEWYFNKLPKKARNELQNPVR